jgi:hypothetical protein
VVWVVAGVAALAVLAVSKALLVNRCHGSRRKCWPVCT